MHSQKPDSNTKLPLVRLSAINPFLLELSRRKVDATAMLKSMGLPGAVPATDKVFVSATTMYELVEKTAVMAADPYFGFSIGRKLNLREWAPIAKAANESETVGDLLNRFIVYSLDHASSTRFFLRTEGNHSSFGFNRLAVPDFLPAQNDAFYLGLLSSMLIRATGNHWDPSSVLFTVAEPAVIPSQALPLRITKGDHAGARVRFPTEWLFESLVKSALQFADDRSTPSRVPESLIESIHYALQPHIHETNLTVEQAASICGFGRRQLARELRTRGTTLAKEIARLRSKHAGKALVDSDQRIADVALSVGFVDPTVFSRAFKNWTGQSPQLYRKLHRT